MEKSLDVRRYLPQKQVVQRGFRWTIRVKRHVSWPLGNIQLLCIELDMLKLRGDETAGYGMS